jgi:hypothetical protein
MSTAEGKSTAVGIAAKPEFLSPARIQETSTAAGLTAAQERTGTSGNAGNSKVETPVVGMLTTVGTPGTAGIPITAETNKSWDPRTLLSSPTAESTATAEAIGASWPATLAWTLATEEMLTAVGKGHQQPQNASKFSSQEASNVAFLLTVN